MENAHMFSSLFSYQILSPEDRQRQVQASRLKLVPDEAGIIPQTIEVDYSRSHEEALKTTGRIIDIHENVSFRPVSSAGIVCKKIFLVPYSALNSEHESYKLGHFFTDGTARTALAELGFTFSDLHTIAALNESNSSLEFLESYQNTTSWKGADGKRYYAFFYLDRHDYKQVACINRIHSGHRWNREGKYWFVAESM